MGSGEERERGGSRYLGPPSRRWPDGRPLCGAKKRREEGFCTWAAGQGTDHLGRGPCERHGGNLPSHKIHAERVGIAELAARYSTPRDVHPLQGVLEQYHRYAGQVSWLEAEVNALPKEALFWGVESETDRSGGEGGGSSETKRKAAPHPKVEQFDKVQREYARLGVEIIRIGLETAGDALASKFAARLQQMLDELMTECAVLAMESPGADLGALFRARMVAKVAAFAGAQPKTVEGVAA
jgi:hypothetical protein